MSKRGEWCRTIRGSESTAPLSQTKKKPRHVPLTAASQTISALPSPAGGKSVLIQVGEAGKEDKKSPPRPSPRTSHGPHPG